MTDHLGTLAGLIADLEELHKTADWSITDSDDIRYCDHCEEDVGTNYGVDIGNRLWPCPTIELTRKHKLAQYEVINIGGGEAVVNLVNRRNVQSPYTHIQEFCGPIADAQAWIDRQVNG